MLDILYNAVLIGIVLLWAFSRAPVLSARLVRSGKKHATQLVVLAWVALIVFAGAYCVFFGQLTRMHDIPYAVNAAVDSEADSLNPYNHSVVPRFDGRYSSTVHFSLGPYNYLPLDLNIYAASHMILGFLGMPYWFVAANLLFSAMGFYLLNRVIAVKWRAFVPLAGIMALFYSFDNVSLTLLLVIASVYLYQGNTNRRRFLAIVFMGLAIMTKIQAVLPFAVLVLFEVQRFAQARDRRIIFETSAGVATSFGIGAALMLPFGIWNVIKAAVLFHADSVNRVGTSTGGTVLTELNLGTLEYSAIVLGVVLASLVVSLLLPRLDDRMLLVSLAFLLVAIKSSQSLLVVPGLFLVLGIRETARLRKMAAEAAGTGLSVTASTISSDSR